MGSDISRPMHCGRSSRKPKYQSVGVQTDPIRRSIGVQTDFPDDDINHYYYGIDHANPRNNHNYGGGAHANPRNNCAHANPNNDTESTRSFGIQADSSDDDEDDDDHGPTRCYTSAEKAKGVIIDDEASETSQYPPIYDSDRSGPSCYRPFAQPQERSSYHCQEPKNIYQTWQRMEEEVLHCGEQRNGTKCYSGGGGYDYEMPCGYGNNYYEPPQSRARPAYHQANNYGGYYYDHMPHQSPMVRPFGDPSNYEPRGYGENGGGLSWSESFARDAADQLFGGIYPYYQVGRY